MSVGTDFPRELARVRELLTVYESLGPAGKVGAVLIASVLRRANDAWSSGDPVAIVRSYGELVGCKE